MRDGQTANAPPRASATARAPAEVRAIFKGSPGTQRNRRISSRFHQLIPHAATMVCPAVPRLASITLRQSASSSIAFAGSSQPSENGSRIGSANAIAALFFSVSSSSPGSP